MFLKELHLNNFRNYSECKLNFSKNKTIFVGKNAQGKTNLLESIYYLATLSSIRASNDNELILKGYDVAKIAGVINKNDTDIKLDVILNPPKKKIIKVNALKKTKYSQFVGNLAIVNFCINDLLLLRGNPSDRRKWIDDAIGQLYPAYKDRLLKYNKIRVQRSNLIKEYKGKISLADYQQDFLSVWNYQFIISGSNLVHLRQKFLKEIQTRAMEKHKHISYGDELLCIKYNSSVAGDFNCLEDDVQPPKLIAEQFEHSIQKKQKKELTRGQTLIGPHRDDISFFVNDLDARLYASQGQQRTIVLALKLAELDFVENIIHDNPLLLLDDVLAELDKFRQQYLLDSIKENTQTIITTVDVEKFDSDYLQDVDIYTVEAGAVRR